MSSVSRDERPELPPVDERIVAPESRHEIEDGRLVYVAPSDRPHATVHSHVDALVRAHLAPGFEVAVDMLTRTTPVDDAAPDVSVYPEGDDPRTGGRQLEHLAFEIVSTESLAHAGRKAVKLTARGVRRTFAIDIKHGHALAWSHTQQDWTILDSRASIEDLVLAVPLPIGALIDTVKTDEVIARALLAKRNPVLVKAIETSRAEGRAESRAEGMIAGEAKGFATAIVALLVHRGLELGADDRGRILRESDPDRLDRWLAVATTCGSVAELLATA